MSSSNLFPYQPPYPQVIETNSQGEGRSALTTPSDIRPARVPQYKDQVSETQLITVESSSNGVDRTDPAPVVNAQVLPTYKQQTDSGVVLPIPNATAVPVFDTSIQTNHETPTHFASSYTMLPKSVRCVGTLIVVFAVAAAGTFGIICASGRCDSKKNEDPSLSTEEIVNLINENSLWDTDIRYPIPTNKAGTPEQQALTWIIEEDEISSSHLQRYALATIWFQSTIPWDMDASRNWLDANTHECEWERITCTDDRIVTELDLREVNAHGTIPRDIAILSDLDMLRMDSNMLTGSLPSELGLLTMLTVLELDQNQFQGSIPTEWASLSRLTVIDLVNAGLSGPVDTVITGWSSIQVLSISDNDFTGSLPALPLPGLFVSFYGYFHNTMLKGTIPYCSFNNQDLFQVAELVADCDSMHCPCCTFCCPEAMNGIPMYEFCAERPRSQSIVAFINSITKSTVTLAYPSTNTVEESALTWLIDDDPLQLHQGNFMQLQQRYALATLYFSGDWQNDNRWLSESNECQWAGIECTNSQSVTELKLTDGENIGGTIPADLALLTNLRLLHLFNNGHTGSIPTSLGSLEFLEELEMEINRLTGTIPTELGKFKSMYSLSLFANGLGSTIPSELGNLSTLILLSLSDNQFTGTIPTSLELLDNLQYVYIHNNDQLGGSLEFLCQRNVTQVADCDIVNCPCCSFCCVEGGFNGIPEFGETEGWCRDGR